MKNKVKFSYESCSIAVIGMDLTCPLCNVDVKSGHSHRCSSPRAPKPEPKKAKGGGEMNKPAIQLGFYGLKCDAEGCDYADKDAVPDEALIGKPCPKCGASLLTADDMAAIRLLQWAVCVANAECGPIPEDVECQITPIHMNGTGNIEFGEPETCA